MKWLIEEALFWYRYARLQYTFWWVNKQLRKAEKRKAASFQIGDIAEYQATLGHKARGVVKRVKDGKCMLDVHFMSSNFTIWVDFKNLTKIEE